MYVKDTHRELAVQTIEQMRTNAAYLLDLASEIENGQNTGYPVLARITEELHECETALIQIEWEE